MRIWGLGFRVDGLGFRGLGFKGYGFRVQGLGVEGLGFGVWGLGFRVQKRFTPKESCRDLPPKPGKRTQAAKVPKLNPKP